MAQDILASVYWKTHEVDYRRGPPRTPSGSVPAGVGAHTRTGRIRAYISTPAGLHGRDGVQVLSHIQLTREVPTELASADVPVQLFVSSPGPSYLELVIRDQLVGRRPLLIGRLPATESMDDAAAMTNVVDDLERRRTSLIDPLVEDQERIFVDYFSAVPSVWKRRTS